MIEKNKHNHMVMPIPYPRFHKIKQLHFAQLQLQLTYKILQ